MLKSLHLKNFTVFPGATFNFGKNLNVIVGENGLGKTHVLKAAYCILAVSARGSRDTGAANPTKGYLQIAIASKLRGVFKPDEIGRLARRQAGRNRCEVESHFAGRRPSLFPGSRLDVSFSFNTSSRSEVTIDQMPSEWSEEVPIYLPTRELLTISPGFVALYDSTHLQFEETWRDTALLLEAPLARGAREARIRELIGPIEEAMGGWVEEDPSGRFYLRTKTGRFEIHLVAEGLRKLAMIARLIATGSLLDKGYLFWDEPNANLNPKLLKLVARTILSVAQSGVQVFIATHNLFLLRELYVLQSEDFRGIEAQCFGLHAKGSGVEVTQGATIDDIGDITSLDEELEQSDRYLETA
ncbi:MAG TPA: AAA family ATPase [Armatimonadota bacterium]|nr:AAA family ATPase [Armatimonadota bacterium]